MPNTRIDFGEQAAEFEESASRHEQFVCLLSGAHHSIYGFLVTLVGDRNVADDLMQDVSLVLWRKFPAFNLEVADIRTGFLKWALAIARNLARNHHRRKRSHDVLFSDELISKVVLTRMAAEELLEIRRHALRVCLQQLSDSERQQLVLCYEAECGVKGVAAQLGKTVEALYMSLSRLRRRLFLCINRKLGLETGRA